MQSIAANIAESAPIDLTLSHISRTKCRPRCAVFGVNVNVSYVYHRQYVTGIFIRLCNVHLPTQIYTL